MSPTSMYFLWKLESHCSSRKTEKNVNSIHGKIIRMIRLLILTVHGTRSLPNFVVVQLNN